VQACRKKIRLIPGSAYCQKTASQATFLVKEGKSWLEKPSFLLKGMAESLVKDEEGEERLALNNK